MANQDKLSFVPGLGTPLKPNNLNRALTEISNRPMSLRPGASEITKAKPLAMEANAKQGSGRKQRTKKSNPRRPAEFNHPLFINTDGFSTSEDFKNDSAEDGRRGLFPERRTAPITFDYKDSNPLTVMQLEDNYTPVQFPSGDTENATPKLALNLGNYHRNFKVEGTGWKRHLEVIFNRYSRDIISTIRSKIVDTWDFANFLTYMEEVTELMEVYYCVDSVLSYEASIDKKDRNPVLVQMKTEFSDFDILVKHDEAKRILKNCWLPDKFSALIAWTYQNYKTGNAEQCANYRIFCDDRFMKNPGQTSFDVTGFKNYYTLKINNVTSINNRNIISLLCQTYPDGKIGRLPLSCSESVYDQNHYEFTINQGIVWPGSDSGFASYTGFPNNDDYNLYSTEVSPEEAGCFPFVLNSTWDSVLNEFSNGVFIPKMRTVKQDGNFMSQTNWDHATNKFYCYNATEGSDNYTVYSRNIEDYSVLSPMEDTHVMRIDQSQTAPSVGITGCNSMSKGHFQNLYFNSGEARLLVMREFLNSMFYLK